MRAGPVSKDIGRFETVVKHNQDECVVQHAMLGEVPPDSSCGVCDDDHAKEPVFNDCGENIVNLCSLMISFSRPENRTSTQSIFSNSGYVRIWSCPVQEGVFGNDRNHRNECGGLNEKGKTEKASEQKQAGKHRDNALPVSTTANAVSTPKTFGPCYVPFAKAA